MNTEVALVAPPKQSLLIRFADRFGVEPNKMMDTLKATAFKADKPVTNEQMMALLVVAEQYSLNPFTRELFAFPDKGGIVPVVSVDGWARIVNGHPQFDGVQFEYDDKAKAVTCIMYRKDRGHPTAVTEYLSECKRNTGPWNTHPLRMLRHKAYIQAARMAFGFAGIFDEDEGHRIINAGDAEVIPSDRTQRMVALTREHIDLDPLPPSDAAPGVSADELVPNFALVMSGVLHADNQDEAALALDMARGTVTSEQYEELTAAYRGKWQPEEK